MPTQKRAADELAEREYLIRIRDEADDVRVLSTLALWPNKRWVSRDIWGCVPDLTLDRVIAALDRLVARGEAVKPDNHKHYWRLASTPLGEG